MSNKIGEHEQRQEIEEIIIDCKFKQLGSVKIQQAIKAKLGIEVSRPMIDKYYKECMSGDVLSRNIEAQARLLNMSAPNDGSGGFVPPVIDLDKLDSIREQYKSKGKGYKTKIEEIRECMALLIESNFQAFIEGRERFKPEYSKYLKDLESIMKSK
jgi:hypothetical protein